MQLGKLTTDFRAKEKAGAAPEEEVEPSDVLPKGQDPEGGDRQGHEVEAEKT